MNNKSRKNLRALMQNGIITAPGAYDAWSAMLIEKAGFPAVYMTGYGVVASLLGKPDIGLITMAEMAHAAHNIVSAVDIPVIADADSGYGTALNVMRTVYEYEMAGVAAIQLEDQVVIKRCGHMEGKQIVSQEEMVSRIKAAISARQDPDLVLIARTDARAVLGLDEAIIRAKAYVAAGADVVFLEALCSREEMQRACSELDVPLLANMVDGGKTPLLSVEELQAMGYRLVIYPLIPLYAATKNCMSALQTLKASGDSNAVQNRLVDFHSFNEMINLNGLLQREAALSGMK
jgi:carboxyvinyl-carboxyphosphonate phosphorylmutase